MGKPASVGEGLSDRMPELEITLRLQDSLSDKELMHLEFRARLNYDAGSEVDSA